MPPAVPPGPPSGRLAQTVRFHRDPLGTLRDAQARYGDVFTLRMATTGPLVQFATAAGAAEVPDADPRPGHAGEARRQIVGMLAARSVLGADGDLHRHLRARVAPVFTPEAIDARRGEMARIAAEHVATWPRGRPFRVLPRMRAIADAIFVRCVVGVRDERRADALAAAIGRMLHTPGNPPASPPGEGAGLAGAIGKRVFDRREEPARAVLREEIAARRGGEAASLGPDLLGCVLADDLTEQEIADELLPIMMAGQEPAAAGLTWLLDRVARTPGAAERFAAAPDDDPWREAFIREAWRLRPAVHSVARRLVEDATIAGVDLPRHAVAVVPIPLVHRDPRVFDDPDEFAPDRFRPGEPDPPSLLPFGGGPRRCLGEPLAHAEVATVLPAILDRVRLRPLSSAPERMVVRGTILVPQRSALMIATS